MPPFSSKEKNFRKSVEVVTATPAIGLGNPTETAAITQELEEAGIRVKDIYPSGAMITAGAVFHALMSSSTERTMKYAENSVATRDSKKAELLKLQLRLFIKSTLKRYPNAEFFLTPQNVLGEEATEVELNGKKFSVIIIMPDAIGKLSPHRTPTEQQRKAQYLVWSEHAYKTLTEEHQLDAHLIKLLDPLKGFKNLNEEQIRFLGLSEIFEKENICVFKLSGSGGDAKLITQIIEALWKNSGIESIVFPGKGHTKMEIALRQWLQGHVKNRNKYNTPTVKSSLDEGLYYNAARQMDHDAQLIIANPSEQIKHSLVLSELGKNPNIVWLPPRGDHEVLNLVHYMYIATDQNLLTTICIPTEYQQQLAKKLGEYKTTRGDSFKQNVHFQLVNPENLSKEHFQKAPNWVETMVHTPAGVAVKNIITKNQ